MIDLNTVWFALFTVLIAGYAVLDGYDLGVGVLHLFTCDERQKRVNLNAIGPVWDGNEVWLLAGGGALFAAFPPVYATVFSGFYLALVLVLAALITRAVSLEFRGKVESAVWKRAWDLAFGLGSLLPALLFGVAVGNILRGLPLGADGEYLGGFLDLLNPYALLIGLLSLSMCLLQGTAFLALKTEGERQANLVRLLRHVWLAFAVLYIAATFATGAVSPHLLRRLESAPLVWAFAGFSLISHALNKEGMLRVEMDLGAAWAAYGSEQARLQTVVGMASQRETLRNALRGSGLEAALADLNALRHRFNVDFLTLVNASGVVVARSRPPFLSGDGGEQNSVVRGALAGQATSGTAVLSADALRCEGEELAERAFIPIIFTERARPSDRAVEDRGLALLAAFPIVAAEERVSGVLYGGVLLNRKFDLVDRIRNSVFGDKMYAGRPVGTVTLFLGDVRIATNVMLDAGTRALGTRVSERVYRTVITEGRRFADRAFVVNDWYLSAYDPIRDPDGKTIGIIYVGLLEKTYLGYKTSLATQFLVVSLGALLLAVGVALYLSSGFRRPVFDLVRATRELSRGNLAARVRPRRASQELMELSQAFNSMAAALEARSKELEETHASLQRAYRASEERNRAYLETLGFVTHELKSPLASIVFALGSLRERILGPLTAEQEALVRAAANSADFLNDTIANYLNLSRIEEGGLRLRLAEVAYAQDVIAPVLHRLGELASERRMRVVSTVGDAVRGTCDAGLMSSVFQNLLSNAIKYGFEGGLIRISCATTGAADELRFSVWNEGPGFEPHAGERLFQKFTRLGRQGADTRSGTGLGLFVSRKIIERHGGRIWATSKAGAWAEFVFVIPTAPAVGDDGVEHDQLVFPSSS